MAVKLGVSLVRKEGKVEGNELAKGMAKLKSMFERKEAGNSTEFKEQLESRLHVVKQGGSWMAPALCHRQQPTTGGLYAKCFVIMLHFEHPWLPSSARSSLKIQQKPFQINMIYR